MSTNTKKHKALVAMASLTLFAAPALSAFAAGFSTETPIGATTVNAAIIGPKESPSVSLDGFEARRQNNGSCLVYYKGMPVDAKTNGLILANQTTPRVVSTITNDKEPGKILDGPSNTQDRTLTYEMSSTRGGWYSTGTQNAKTNCGPITITDDFNNFLIGQAINGRIPTTGEFPWTTSIPGITAGSGGVATVAAGKTAEAYIDTKDRTDGVVSANISPEGGDGVVARKNAAGESVRAFLVKEKNTEVQREKLWDKLTDSPYYTWDRTTTTRTYNYDQKVTEHWRDYTETTTTYRSFQQPQYRETNWTKYYPVQTRTSDVCYTAEVKSTVYPAGYRWGTLTHVGTDRIIRTDGTIGEVYSQTGMADSCNSTKTGITMKDGHYTTAEAGRVQGSDAKCVELAGPKPAGTPTCYAISYRTQTLTPHTFYNPWTPGTPSTSCSNNSTTQCGTPEWEQRSTGSWIDISSCLPTSSPSSSTPGSNYTSRDCSSRIDYTANTTTSRYNLRNCVPQSGGSAYSGRDTIVCSDNGARSATYWPETKNGVNQCISSWSNSPTYYTTYTVSCENKRVVNTVVLPEYRVRPCTVQTPSPGDMSHIQVQVECNVNPLNHSYALTSYGQTTCSTGGNPNVYCRERNIDVTYESTQSDVSWGEVAADGTYTEWSRNYAGKSVDRFFTTPVYDVPTGNLISETYALQSTTPTGRVPVNWIGLRANGSNYTLYIGSKAAPFTLDTKVSSFASDGTGWGIMHSSDSPNQGSRIDNFSFGL